MRSKIYGYEIPLLEKGSVDDTALRTDKTTLAARSADGVFENKK